MRDYIPISDIYEYAVDALKKGELTAEQEELVLDNLKSLEWTKAMLDKLSGLSLIEFYIKITNDLKGTDFPVDPMSISCMYYNFKQRIDASEMREVINTSEYIYRESKNLLFEVFGYMKN